MLQEGGSLITYNMLQEGAANFAAAYVRTHTQCEMEGGVEIQPPSPSRKGTTHPSAQEGVALSIKTQAL